MALIAFGTATRMTTTLMLSVVKQYLVLCKPKTPKRQDNASAARAMALTAIGTAT